MIHNASTQSFEFIVGQGITPDGAQPARVRFGEGAVGRAALERQMITLRGAAVHAELAHRFSVSTGERFCSLPSIRSLPKG